MQILRLLGDGGVLSGEQLGTLLGVSRAAIWKQVAALRKKGFIVEVVQGKGYRLATPFEFLAADMILRGLAPGASRLVSQLRVFERVGSTNDVVAGLMREGASQAIICLAEEQSRGRGRRGRAWVSPFGRNLYCSIGWTFDGVSEVEGLSLAVGVAVIRALTRYGVVGVTLKWPNDLLIADAKLGGVLIEIEAEASGPCKAVIGIGLNLSPLVNDLSHLDQPVADLSSHLGGAVKRNVVAALIIEEVLLLLEHYTETRFEAFRNEWLRFDAFSGAEVVVTGFGDAITGIARGVDERGALIMQTSAGVRRLHGGEVSLRKREG